VGGVWGGVGGWWVGVGVGGGGGGGSKEKSVTVSLTYPARYVHFQTKVGLKDSP